MEFPLVPDTLMGKLQEPLDLQVAAFETLDFFMQSQPPYFFDASRRPSLAFVSEVLEDLSQPSLKFDLHTSFFPPPSPLKETSLEVPDNKPSNYDSDLLFGDETTINSKSNIKIEEDQLPTFSPTRSSFDDTSSDYSLLSPVPSISSVSQRKNCNPNRTLAFGIDRDAASDSEEPDDDAAEQDEWQPARRRPHRASARRARSKLALVLKEQTTDFASRTNRNSVLEDFSDEYLFNISTKELNKVLKTSALSDAQVLAIRKARRRVKNRNYATTFRCRQRLHHHDLADEDEDEDE